MAHSEAVGRRGIGQASRGEERFLSTLREDVAAIDEAQKGLGGRQKCQNGIR